MANGRGLAGSHTSAGTYPLMLTPTLAYFNSFLRFYRICLPTAMRVRGRTGPMLFSLTGEGVRCGSGARGGMTVPHTERLPRAGKLFHLKGV